MESISRVGTSDWRLIFLPAAVTGIEADALFFRAGPLAKPGLRPGPSLVVGVVRFLKSVWIEILESTRLTSS